MKLKVNLSYLKNYIFQNKEPSYSESKFFN